jgi:hypothetical protein
MVWHDEQGRYRALTTFKLEGEVTSLSGSSQGEVEDNREKWGAFWEKLMSINQNIILSIHVDASYQVSVHMAKQFQGEEFLEIDQSETRIACGGHVC